MRTLQDPLPIPARHFVPLALLLFGLSSCGGGGGSPSVTAVADSYYVNNSGAPITIGAPGVLQNDSGSGLTAQLVSGPGTLTLNTNGSFTITGGTPTSFTYRAVNGTGSATATATISINQPPVANNACTSTPAGTPIGNGVLTATDPDNQTLTYQLVTGGTKGTVNVFPDGRYTYTPNTNLPSSDNKARGMDKFTFRVTDPFSLSSTAVVTVLIDGAVRIMPLGDSITAGITDGNNPPTATRVGYRLDLFNGLTTLSAGKYGIDFVGSQSEGAGAGLSDVNHEGHPGWCDDNTPTCNLGSGIDATITDFLNTNPADVILLHIGTNSFGTSSTGVNTILDNVNTWAGSNYPVNVFVARIIPTTDGSLDVQTFNNNVAPIATDRPNVKVFRVDQQSELDKPGDPNPNVADPNLMTVGNNLHPNAAGYTKMANRWQTDMINAGVLPNCP